MLLLAQAAFCTNYTVNNEQALRELVPKLQAGDKVLIAEGTYTPWAITLNTQGTQKLPVIIEAATPGKVIFTGTATQPIFKLTGSYTILKGIHFNNCTILREGKQPGVLVEMNNTKHCRLTACTFYQNIAKSQYLPLVIVGGPGEYNTVDNCLFSGNIDNQDVQVKVTKENAPHYTLIEKNKFENKAPVSWTNNNGGECIQIGQDPVLLGHFYTNTTVRNNKFIRCKGEPEVISNKCSNNYYRDNYFEDCDGELVMRGGHDCIIENNTIVGGNCGIRVNGTGHIIQGNKITNVKTGIRLMYGMVKHKGEVGFYVAASDCVVKNNKIENTQTAIFVGDAKNVDWRGKFDTIRYPSRVMQDVAPYNNTLVNNKFKQNGTTVVEQ
ncbi:chondroitinase B-like protein [Chitinophaga skermanii]|uniref:Chondroitinase B-like protein n=2 Tax=Chitinophaga skermanii TaxID=331697 RepID=A0A327Q6F1_9BACT|nr:chondroitinase B-like protein [Chitinophaga skermanii]